MFLKKYFLLDNYFARLRKIKKKILINNLEKSKAKETKLTRIWNLTSNNRDLKFLGLTEYSIFGKKINLEENINWHQDNFSNFTYPIKRFDKINPVQWFDKGIELVYPWEQSRFYFGVNLAQKYLITRNEFYYNIIVKQIEDWIDKNPFLQGVNWLSTMDVAIRAVNWIVALNLINNFDKNKYSKISKSLIEHAEYINSFPLIEKNGLTTNHTTSAYTGLLFISLTFLNNTVDAEKWIENSINGLEKCIETQIYDDGVDFEGSIPYHRLVLELFSYSTIVAHSNGIKFSDQYYCKLFKMFEFVSAYLNINGFAPQIGDNDSGRLLIFNSENNDPYENEDDHAYLLNLGEHIFDHQFSSVSNKRDKIIYNYLPKIEKINLFEKKIVPRKIGSSFSFEKGGFYFLKNKHFDLCVSLIPIGQNGKGGHNHLDVGSFTLSIDGMQIIVDPGSFCYSQDKIERNKFRSYYYHNTLYNELDEKLDLSENGFWNLKKYYKYEVINFENNIIEFKINFINDINPRFRKFELSDNILKINDTYNGKFFSRINLASHIKNIEILKNSSIYLDTNNISFSISNSNKIKLEEYQYSPHYGKKEKAKNLLIEAKNNLVTEIKL